MKNNVLILNLFVMLLTTWGCGRSPEKFNPSLGKNVADELFGPRRQDSSVSFGDSGKSLQTKKALLVYAGEAESADVLGLSGKLFRLSDSTGQIELSQLADKIANSFYSANQTTSSVPLRDSHFMNVVLGQIESGFQEALGDLDGQADLVIDILSDVASRYSFANKNTLPQTAINMLTEANDEILADPELIADVKTAVSDILVEYLDDLLPPIVNDYSEMLSSNNPTRIVQLIEVNLARFNYELEGSTKQKINQVKPVSVAINAINGDAQRALTAIVLLWEFSDSSQRAQFRNVSPELYDQLKGADAETLQCWKRNDFCWDMGFSIWVIEKPRKKFLYQALEDFGLAAIENSLAEQVSDGIRDEIYALIDDLLSDLNSLFDSLVRDEFDAKVAELTDSTNDIHAKLAPQIDVFSQNNFQSSSISRFEVQSVNFDLKGSQDATATPLMSIGSASTGARVLGSGLSAQSLKWVNSQSSLVGADLSGHRSEVVGALEKIFSMGGYTGIGGEVVRGLSRGTANPQVETFDLNRISEQSYNYAVSDEQPIDGEPSLDRSVSIGSQAAMLNGLVDMMSFLQDWNGNSFDEAFEDLIVSDVLTTNLRELAGSQGDLKLFPKDQMFALAVAHVAITLQGLELPGSPLVLIEGDRFEFVKGPETFDTITPVAVAAAGWKDGRRDFRVNVRELADFLIALTRVHKAIGTLKNSQSELLNDSSGGKSPLQLLEEARDGALENLILGVGNFLVSRAQAENGAVAEAVDLNGFERIGVGQNVGTHARVISALLAASDILQTDIYRWGAQDVYFFLNAEAWNKDIEFYKLSEDPTIFTVVDMVTALTQLRPVLSTNSQSQLDVIIGRWQEALRTF